jgi:hypothetical protein
MQFLLGVLIIAAVGPSAQVERHPDAVEVFHCTFGKRNDANFDHWPDHWVRKTGLHYPHYLKIEIEELAEATEGHVLKLELDGGAATIYSPPVAVDSQFSYLLEGKLRTAGLNHNRASMSVTFYDGENKAVQTIYSDRIRDADEWMTLRIGPFSPQDARVEMAVIGLHLRPGEREDLRGSVQFDDVWLARLPQVKLTTNSEYNVYTDPDAVEVTCSLSGILERDPEITFELLDASSRVLAENRVRLDGVLIEQKLNASSELIGGEDKKPAGYAGTASWKPPLEDFGFYRVRVRMNQSGGAQHERHVTLAVIRPLGKPTRGEFGWSLPKGEDPLPLESLQGLLPHAGINWLKFPVWYSEQDTQQGDRLMWFAERLGLKGIELVGVLDTPPTETLSQFGDDQTSAANIFSSDPTLWFPSLDPVMTRLSLKIRWWQLGDDHDTSFVGYPDLVKKVVEIRKQLYRFGQEVHLGIGWTWQAETVDDPLPPWQFLTFSANPPLTGPEMATYLAGSQGEASHRWVLVEPLPRSHYSMATRARDLVEQMMSAKIERADGIFVPNPISTEHGLMNDDGTPGELLLPWRTTALMLGGSTYLGSIRMPGGSENHIYTRNDSAVMVVWNEKPTREAIYLGDDVRQVDIWGRMTSPQQREHRQQIEVGPLPTFITGINEDVTRWRMAVRFAEQRMPSVFGKAHQNALYMKNNFAQGAGGEVRLNTPNEWKTFPQTINFKLALGEELPKPFEVTLPFSASSGQQEIRLDFDINIDRHYRFSVYRELDVGLGDVVVELTTKLDEQGFLIVEQRMSNHLDRIVDFKCLLHAPGRRRQSNQVFRLGRGQDIKRYRYANGSELVGKELWLRAEELGGQRILNYRFTAIE